MKKYIFRIFSLCVAIFMLIPSVNVQGKEFHWYCKRNKEHKQPTCDSGFSFLESLGGIYVDKVHGDECEEKVIYLTFDVGYENGNVGKILDVMKAEGVVGSFFILGNVIERNPDLVLRMANEGHIVCNHTLNHPNLVGKSEEVFKDEVLGLENQYKELMGKEITYNVAIYTVAEGVEVNDDLWKLSKSKAAAHEDLTKVAAATIVVNEKTGEVVRFTLKDK